MKNKNGAVLFITIVILAIVVIMAAGICTMISRDIYTIKRHRSSTQAYFLAEAGIEEGIRELYDNFDPGFNNFPINKNIGNGSFTTTLNTARYSAEKIIKVTSTGAVGDVTRTMSAVVKDTRTGIEAFKYSALSGGRMIIWSLTDVEGNVHSNSSTQSISQPAVLVGFFCRVTGIVSSNKGKIVVFGQVGGKNENHPPVEINPFSDAAWNDYKKSADIVYNGSKGWVNANLNGVIWVDGSVTMLGICTLTGSIIATGQIYILGALIQAPKSGRENVPPLMSKNRIIIFGPSVIKGLIFATNEVYTTLVTIDDGAVMSNGKITMYLTDLDYKEPSPQGPPALEVVYWSQ